VIYRNYENLQQHHKISHYICEDPQCLLQRFVAYKTAAELDLHTQKVHIYQQQGTVKDKSVIK